MLETLLLSLWPCWRALCLFFSTASPWLTNFSFNGCSKIQQPCKKWFYDLHMLLHPLSHRDHNLGVRHLSCIYDRLQCPAVTWLQFATFFCWFPVKLCPLGKLSSLNNYVISLTSRVTCLTTTIKIVLKLGLTQMMSGNSGPKSGSKSRTTCKQKIILPWNQLFLLPIILSWLCFTQLLCCIYLYLFI